MPEIDRLALTDIPAEIEKVISMKVPAVQVFRLPDHKDTLTAVVQSRHIV